MHVFLNKYRADPNAQDFHGRTPIHLSVSCGNYQALRFIIENYKTQRSAVRPDLDVRTVGGETALYKAVLHLEFQCLRILLDNGADTSVTTFEDESIFDLVSSY